jgi:hypothetical protein
MPRLQNPAAMTIAVLEKMLQKRRSELDSLTRERRRVLKQLAAIDDRLRTVSGGAIGGAALTPRGRVRNSMSLVAAMAQVLEKAGKPLKVRDIAQGVLDSGYQSEAVNFRTMVNQMLIKQRKQFAKVDRAVYALKK